MTVTTIFALTDAYTMRWGVDESWATITGGNGTHVDLEGDAGYKSWAGLTCSTTSNQFSHHYRSSITFNTAAIPDEDTIVSAILSPYGEQDDNYFTMSGTKPNEVIVGGTPADPTLYVAADYQQVGTVKVTDDYYGLQYWIDTDAYIPFNLNSYGRDYIKKLGYTVFYLITNWDFARTFGGTWSSTNEAFFCFTSASYTGTTYDPKLVITHEKTPRPPGAVLGSGNCMMY